MVSHMSIFCLYVAWVVTAPSSKNTSQTCLVCTSPWLQAESMCTLLIGSTLKTQQWQGVVSAPKTAMDPRPSAPMPSPAFFRPFKSGTCRRHSFVRSYPGKSSPLRSSDASCHMVDTVASPNEKLWEDF